MKIPAKFKKLDVLWFVTFQFIIPLTIFFIFAPPIIIEFINNYSTNPESGFQSIKELLQIGIWLLISGAISFISLPLILIRLKKDKNPTRP